MRKRTEIDAGRFSCATGTIRVVDNPTDLPVKGVIVRPDVLIHLKPDLS
jgi:hypothetical protein